MAQPLISSLEKMIGTPRDGALLRYSLGTEYLKTGDRVRVKEGYFQNFEGDVHAIDQAHGRVTVMINIFGRATPVEIEHWQIEAV